MVFGVEMIILTSMSLSTLNVASIEELFTIFKRDFIALPSMLKKKTAVHVLLETHLNLNDFGTSLPKTNTIKELEITLV